MTPTVGRIVHLTFKPLHDGPIAALVTHVREGGAIDVTAFPPGAQPTPFAAVHENEPAADGQPSWSWPPRA